MSYNLKGFTIIELMIASAVFSVILLLVTFGVMKVTKYYYKSITTGRTQENARQVIDEISQSVQFGGGNVVTNITSNGSTNGFCLGNTRYSYLIDTQLVDNSPDTTKHQAKHVLVADTVGSCSSATQAIDLNNISLNLGSYTNARELLGLKMRIAEFNIGSSTPNLYFIKLSIIYGDDDVLSSDRLSCADTNSGGQFCAYSTLSTTVLKRVL